MERRGVKMRVDLRALKPNPMRDFAIDPIDHEIIARLRQSIEEDGFWGGVACRMLPDGTVQIGAGHHRVAAALEAGITTADVFVADDMDDGSMVRVYARENATQRGHSSTALTGTVASAIKYIAKVILTGRNVADEFISKFDIPTLRRRMLSEDGMGREIVLAFLHDIPGINAPALQQQIANLKASGDYARLIAEVQRELAAEQAPTEAQDLAQEAATQAARTPKTFDFQGVAQHLRNPHQVDVFRSLVTAPAVRERLPVTQQAPLAAHIVEYAEAHDEHLSGECIRRNFSKVLLGEQLDVQAADREREADDPAWQFGCRLDRLERRLTLVVRTAQELAELLDGWPPEAEPPVVPLPVRQLLYETLARLTALHEDRRFQDEQTREEAQARTRRHDARGAQSLGPHETRPGPAASRQSAGLPVPFRHARGGH